MTRRARLAAPALLAFALAACQTGAPTASSPPAFPSQPPSAAPTAVESETPPESALPSLPSGFPSFVLPSFTRAEDLEAILPDELGGTTLQKFSFRGSDLFGDDPNDENDQQFQALIQALGARPDDYAIAAAGGEVGGTNVQIGAIRVEGIDGARLLQALIQVGQIQEPDTLVDQTTIAGKNVTRVADPADLEDLGPSYIYPAGEVIFFVQSTDEDLVAQALAELP
ncbi:MAG TPA: hypothetical protein VGQ47_04530 [Candidatus Limnocylindrales bacterium]|nr:hypothetical protein [Candidatus Limnocylindrales bacterium]